MTMFGSPYYVINKRALQFYGQWPFQSAVENRLKRVLIFLVVLSITVPKFIKFFESFDDVDELILCMPMMVLHSTAHVKFFCWSTNAKKMKRLIETIQRDWDSIKSEDDRAILHEHSERGRSYTTAYATFMLGITASYLTTPGIPKILDIIAPLNESRPKIYLYETEYFVDQDEYYLQILFHAYMTVPVSAGIIVFFDNMFALYINHACGMFEIVSTHLQRLHLASVENEKDDESNELIKIHDRITYCAKLHNDTIEFIELAGSTGSGAILLVVGLNTLLITVTGMSTVMKLDEPSEASRNFAFTVGGIFHLFYISSQWNLLIEGSGKIYRDAYSSEWYTFPPHLQKLLIPIMIRSRKPCYLTAGGIYVMSMESFSNVLRKSMSFFTVLNSAR